MGIGKKVISGLKIGAPVFDVLFSPFTLLAASWFRVARFWGFRKLPLTKSILLKLGVFPVVDHYYEPVFDYRKAGKRKALLTGNPNFEIVFALNYLFVTHRTELEKAFPGNMSSGHERKPGSFWIRKR